MIGGVYGGFAEGELGALRDPEPTSSLGKVFSMASGVGVFDISELGGKACVASDSE